MPKVSSSRRTASRLCCSSEELVQRSQRSRNPGPEAARKIEIYKTNINCRFPQNFFIFIACKLNCNFFLRMCVHVYKVRMNDILRRNKIKLNNDKKYFFLIFL